MISLLATLVMFVVPLSSPFGEASATATSVDDRLRLEVSVEVEGSPAAVVVRGVGSGNAELPPVALGNRGDGVWVGIVDLPVVENIRLGFEFIPQQGPAKVSELHTLTELGVDRAVFAFDAEPTGFGEETPPDPQGRRWGWLALAAGVGALTLVAWWAIGGVRSRRGSEGEGPIDQDPGGIDQDGGDPIVD
ncbi:MAG: hypothetical protein QNJ77_08380 [Acidimicrobiia bacterium]|nr:hypothetical protein [Acidimicrobiia bacterium]